MSFFKGFRLSSLGCQPGASPIHRNKLHTLCLFSLQPDSLIVNLLPFAEDIREYPFLALGDQPESKQPNVDQMELAEKLVQSLDLAPGGGEEMLEPEKTPNPTLKVRIGRPIGMRPNCASIWWSDSLCLRTFVELDSCSHLFLFFHKKKTWSLGVFHLATCIVFALGKFPFLRVLGFFKSNPYHCSFLSSQRFYSFLHRRAMRPEAELPPIDEAARAVIAPDPHLLEAATPLLEDFQSKFSLTVAAIVSVSASHIFCDHCNIFISCAVLSLQSLSLQDAKEWPLHFSRFFPPLLSSGRSDSSKSNSSLAEAHALSLSTH
jgi:hypothetical protein